MSGWNIFLIMALIMWSLIGILISYAYLKYNMPVFKKIILLIICGPLIWVLGGICAVVELSIKALNKFFIGR